MVAPVVSGLILAVKVFSKAPSLVSTFPETFSLRNCSYEFSLHTIKQEFYSPREQRHGLHQLRRLCSPTVSKEAIVLVLLLEDCNCALDCMLPEEKKKAVTSLYACRHWEVLKFHSISYLYFMIAVVYFYT